MSAGARDRRSDTKRDDRAVYVVDGARTPFLKARNRPGPVRRFRPRRRRPGARCCSRMPFAPDELDEVILGCASPSPDEVNIGRVVALRMGCGLKVPGWTVMRNCASGMQALDSAHDQHPRRPIEPGARRRRRRAVARAAALLGRRWCCGLPTVQRARRRSDRKPARLLKLSPAAMLAPVIGIMKGLTDPMVGLMMGQTAENLAYRFGITRARDGRVRGARATAACSPRKRPGTSTREIVPLYDAQRQALRRRTTACAKTRRRRTWRSSSPSSTASTATSPRATARRSPTARPGWCSLRSGGRQAQAAGARARSSTAQWAGLDPAEMGLGPVHAATPMLQRHGLALDDLDAWEINEAFAAQVIACLRAWESDEYCRNELGLDRRARHARSERSSTSTAARSRWATRSAPRARASCCTAERARADAAASAAWRRSASAADRAARCWSSARERMSAASDRASSSTGGSSATAMASPG